MRLGAIIVCVFRARERDREEETVYLLPVRRNLTVSTRWRRQWSERAEAVVELPVGTR
jgi:hypothetical protein